jgi:apolipoprotein N-acyltransferase
VVGWLHGAVAQGIALASVAGALRSTMGTSRLVAALGLILLAAYEGARFGLVALGAAWARKRGWPLLVTFPLMLAVSERLYPMFFPWSTALLFHVIPTLLQVAELGGTMAISLWVGFADAALAVAWLNRGEPRTVLRHALIIPGATFAGAVTYGLLRLPAIDAISAQANALTIGLVQGNIEGNVQRSADPLGIYRDASRDLLTKNKVDVLIWPETAAARIVREDMVSAFLSSEMFARTANANDTSIASPILTGLILERSEHASRNDSGPSVRRRFNSVVLASPPGRVLGSYDKRSLVPFGEYLPFEQILPGLRKVFPTASTFSAGSRARALLLGETRILPLICFEDILADQVRADVLETNPDLLVNVTSDAWFGNSRLAELHFAIARLRAVEHRRFLVRATNTGVSAVIDAGGREVARLPAHATATTVVTVRLLRQPTPYERWGGMLEGLLVAAALTALVIRPPAKHNGSD